MVVQSRSNPEPSVEYLSWVQQVFTLCQKYLENCKRDVHIVPQRRGGGVFGRGGVVHSVPHTAGLNMKPHYCKLPQFTLSKGAKMDKTTTKKDSFNFWETSHGLIKLSTCTYHKLYPLCVLMKCYTVLWSVVLLSVRFFFLLWVLPDACRSVIVCDTDFDCCVHRRERSRSGRGGS